MNECYLGTYSAFRNIWLNVNLDAFLCFKCLEFFYEKKSKKKEKKTVLIPSILILLKRQPKSHVTHQSSGHVTNQRCYVSTFTRPMDPKLSRVVKKPHVKCLSSGQVTNQKYFIFTFTRCKAHKLSRVAAVRMRRPHATCHVLNHAVT